MQLRKGDSRLALAAAVVAGTIAACSTERAEDTDARRSGDGASISLSLQPVAGLTINEIAWVVTRGSELPAVGQGIIPVPGDGRNLSFGVPLPAGTNYFLSMAAVSPDGSFTCTADAGPFAVEARLSTELSIVLTCIQQIGSQATGPVDVVSDACPTLTVNFALAEPAIAAIGESLTLTVEASDSGGKPISYAWSVADPTVGTFTNPLSQSTAFTCTAPAGNAIITVTADNGECDTALDLAVSCVTTECGDGIIQPGETCDVNDPATPSCPADCTEICGDGIVEGSEQCEPPNTPVCTATCQHCVDCDSFCGDGIVQPLEACDPPFSGPNCGDLHPQAVAGATLACATIESATCSSCIATEGFDDFDCLNETGNAMAGPAAGQPRQRLCYELLDCVYDTNCAAADPIDCYCGTSGAACQTGGANGLCRAEIERSFESTAFGDIAARFGDPSFAGGVAIIRVDGSRAACGSACGTL